MAADSRVCPACGTRNKLKWEFCVKCGESLQDIEPERAASTAAPASVPSSEGAGASWASTLGTIVALGLAVYIGFRFRPEAATAAAGLLANPAAAEFAAQRASPSIAPVVPEPNLNDALRNLRSRNTQSALEQLAQAVAERPNDVEARFAYGHALYQAGKAELALAQLLEASRLDPRHARASADAAKLLIGLGRPAEAIPLLETAIAEDPSSPAWLSQLGRLYMDKGEPGRAAQVFEKAATASHNNARFLEELGYALEKSGNAEGATAAYRKALASDPNSGSTRALLAERMLAAGKADDAIALVREGVQRDARLNMALGSLLERSGRPREAAEAYRDYARQNPKAPDAVTMETRAKVLEGSSS